MTSERWSSEDGGNRDKRLSETREMFNVIGICCDEKIGRLVGFYEDALDYYYRIRFKRGVEVLHSQVGWFIPLRDALTERQYSYLEQVFSLNGCPPADEFLVGKAGREEDVAMYGERILLRYED